MERFFRGVVTAIGVAGFACALAGCGADEPPPDVHKQIDALAGSDDEARWTALATLRDIGPAGAPAVPQLRSMLAATTDDVLRSEIARALAGMGPGAAAAVDDLVPLLASKDAWVRQTAAEALGGIGADATPAIQKLNTLAKDRDPAVAEAAQVAARRIQRARARGKR